MIRGGEGVKTVFPEGRTQITVLKSMFCPHRNETRGKVGSVCKSSCTMGILLSKQVHLGAVRHWLGLYPLRMDSIRASLQSIGADWEAARAHARYRVVELIERGFGGRDLGKEGKGGVLGTHPDFAGFHEGDSRHKRLLESKNERVAQQTVPESEVAQFGESSARTPAVVWLPMIQRWLPASAQVVLETLGGREMRIHQVG